MKAPSDSPLRPWPARSPVVTWVPSIVVVAVIAALALAGTASGREQPVASMTGPSLEEARNYGNNPDLPVTYEDAKKAGTVDKTLLAALPKVDGTPVLPTDAQSKKTAEYLGANWSKVIS